MISAAHMLGGMLSSEKSLKNVQLGASWCTFLSDFELKLFCFFKVISYCIEHDDNVDERFRAFSYKLT